MYTPEQRQRLRAELERAARADPRITGAAIFGSGAVAMEDQWSDIDLAFGVRNASDVQSALADWTVRMYGQHEALHHVDVLFGAWVYRVFLRRDTLQVDLAFAPQSDFGALAPTFRLLFGAARELPQAPPPAAEHLIGMGWLHALHARSCIARRKLWQAEYMVSGVRDHALALACLRRGLPATQGRGLDRLPSEVTSALEAALVRHADARELTRAFRAAIDGFLTEIHGVNEELAQRLEAPLRHLTDNGQTG